MIKQNKGKRGEIEMDHQFPGNTHTDTYMCVCVRNYGPVRSWCFRIPVCSLVFVGVYACGVFSQFLKKSCICMHAWRVDRQYVNHGRRRHFIRLLRSIVPGSTMVQTRTKTYSSSSTPIDHAWMTYT